MAHALSGGKMWCGLMIMSVEKLQHKVECSVHVAGRDMHVEAIDADMYAAIDALADKLDRQVLKHKEKLTLRRHEAEPMKRPIIAPPQYRPMSLPADCSAKPITWDCIR